MVGGFNEVWINNILSFLVILMINIGFVVVYMFENNIIDIGGVVCMGNVREMCRVVIILGRELIVVFLVFKYMLKVVNESKGFIDSGCNFVGDVEDFIGIGICNYKMSKFFLFKGEGIYKKGEGFRGVVMNLLGNINRLFGLCGMVVIDEFIK